MICGKDGFLAEEEIAKVLQNELRKDFMALNINRLDGKKLQSDEIIQVCEQLPVFDECRAVLINELDLFQRKGKADKEIQKLTRYLSEKPDYLRIVFISEEMPYWYNELYAFLKKNGAIFELNGAGPGGAMLGWLMKKAQKNALMLDKEQGESLLLRCGYYEEDGGPGARSIRNELLKLAAYVQDGALVTEADIKAVITPYESDSVDQFISALNKRNSGQAQEILLAALRNGVYPTVLSSAMVRNFSAMLLYRQYAQQGKRMNAWDLMARIKKLKSISFLRKDNAEEIIRCAKQFKMNRIKNIIILCAKYDNALKAGEMDAKAGLERMIYYICDTGA